MKIYKSEIKKLIKEILNEGVFGSKDRYLRNVLTDKDEIEQKIKELKKQNFVEIQNLKQYDKEYRQSAEAWKRQDDIKARKFAIKQLQKKLKIGE